MYGRIIALIFLLPALYAQDPANELLNQGVAAFKAAHYSEAITAFERSVAQNPSSVPARLYLATAYLSQWIPGATDASNVDLGLKAEAEFKHVLELQSNNAVALRSLASLKFNQKKFDEAREFNERLIGVEPSDKAAYYSLGVIAWSKFYPELQSARKQLGMRPEDPGPIRDFNLRIDLRNRFSGTIEEGIKNLELAIKLDPQYSDAMAYLNLLYRERGDLQESDREYREDVARADQWVGASLEAKRLQSNANSTGLPVPPPPSGALTRVRIGGNVQKANLLNAPPPVYPALAAQARVQGTVTFAVIINKDGAVQNAQLLNGHPLLVQSATDAVKQYTYKPTLLNGQPVEVITQVEVKFALPN